MAANSPRKRNNGGSSPLPISALPMPMDEAPAPDDSAAPALPINSSGELTPAQRARLGLDIYGDQPAPTPITNGNGNGNGHAPANGNGAAPAGQAPPAPSAQPTEFGFTEIDPYNAPSQPSTPEPRLAPAKTTPKLAPVTPAGSRVRARTSADDHEDPDANAGSRSRSAKQSINDRDGTPQIDRDRKVFTYGVSWTVFCIFITATISFANVFTNAGEGASPGTFLPAMISIVIGWVIVFAARNMGPNWGWLMLIPAVVLVIGPFFYTSWRIGQTQAEALAYLSSQAAKAEVDIDASTVVSETINTPQGCFAFTKILETGDVTIDVVTYAPTTAQQQATMSLSPRFARRVEPGGTRANQRTFSMDKGSLPVVVEERLSAPIDCANASAP
ncbi:MAG: hypothetical protein ACRDKE_08825 [Solirubrobacterales bacterium]